jgi:hypothetical protein
VERKQRVSWKLEEVNIKSARSTKMKSKDRNFPARVTRITSEETKEGRVPESQHRKLHPVAREGKTKPSRNRLPHLQLSEIQPLQRR